MMELKLNAHEPIYIQIKKFILMKIAAKELKAGDRILSVRDYATELKVNPNTIQRVYTELEREEYIVTQRGIGKFITTDEEVLEGVRTTVSEELVRNLVNTSKELGLSKKEIYKIIEDVYGQEGN